MEMNIDGTLIGAKTEEITPGSWGAPADLRPSKEIVDERLKKNGWKKKKGEWLAPARPTSKMNQLIRSALGIKTQGKGMHRDHLGPSLPPTLEERRREERRERREKK